MNQRQQDILRLLEKHGEITIKELSETLGVTTMTIHRDLDLLEKENYLFKKRGAAVFINSQDRAGSTFYLAEKRRIAQHAVKLIRPGQSILFDNSTTAIEAARCLGGIPKLTFYTTNLEIAAIVADYPDTLLYCSGGFYFKDSRGFVGPQTEEFVSKIHADVCLTSVSGVDIAGGLTGPYPMHTSLQKKILAASDVRIIMADHSKFGKRAAEKCGDLKDASIVITDSGLSKSVAAEYAKYTRIEIAE